MGLDMYLYAEKYMGGNTDKPELYAEIKNLAGLKDLPTPDFSNVVVKSMVGYWRKANAIHGWIVDKCGKGVDECQTIYLSDEDLLNLRNDCIKALANPNREYQIENNKVFYQLCDYLNKLEQPITVENYENPLQPVEGFFFGGNELSDYYFYQLEYTIDLITSLLESDQELNFTYQASW
jgi:hypothetical protein